MEIKVPVQNLLRRPLNARSKRLGLLVLAALALAGCQRYEWVHPTKSLEQFGTDKFACETRASRLYPVTPVTEVQGGGYVYDDFPHCHHRYGGLGMCYSQPPMYVPPTYSTRDLNEKPRNQAVESCLFSKGYELVPAK
jgi:hypothetical protein